MRARSARGFSLLELLIVVSIVCVVSAVAVINLRTVRNAIAVNDAYSMVMREVQAAHQLAIDQRCVAHLHFDPTGTIPNTGGIGTMLIETIKGGATTKYEVAQILPNGVQFTTASFAGKQITSPDGFGTGLKALDFGTDYGGGKADIYFQPDGTALDSLLRGQINNGVVYFGRPSEQATARAVSLMGATGRVKGWRLVSVAGGLQWK